MIYWNGWLTTFKRIYQKLYMMLFIITDPNSFDFCITLYHSIFHLL